MSAVGAPHVPSPEGVPSVDVYRLAAEEYRFQAEFSWSRTRYFLAFSTAILAAGSALSAQGAVYAVPVFAWGILASVIAAIVTRLQHRYYRAARERMSAVERALDLDGPYIVGSTVAVGKPARLFSEPLLAFIMLGTVALADVVGIVLVLTTGR
jgi:hypothetical protein